MRTRCVPCFLALVAFVALQTACSRGPSEEELKLNELRQQLTDITTQALESPAPELATKVIDNLLFEVLNVGVEDRQVLGDWYASSTQGRLGGKTKEAILDE